MIDRRRILGSFAVFALVVLRLVIGWHFFGEGTKKLQYDRQYGGFRMAFSADDFLLVAKGPLASLYLAHTPEEHGWRQLIATPRENAKSTAEQAAAQAKWQREYRDRQAAAEKKHELVPVEFPPNAAYTDWANRIKEDWQSATDKVKAITGLTDAQKQQVEKIFNTHLHSLAQYFESQDEEITAYRHDLWRLAEWRGSPEAGGVPFYQQRIGQKTAETAGQLKPWRAAVASLDSSFHDAVQNILSPEQQGQPSTSRSVGEAFADPHQHKLDFINTVVTAVVIGVGVCLLLGLFTRTASVFGALFLFGVIASQPFWLADAAPTMPQYIEFAALLVLAGTGPGRWFGLDFIIYALRRRRREAVAATII